MSNTVDIGYYGSEMGTGRMVGGTPIKIWNWNDKIIIIAKQFANRKKEKNDQKMFLPPPSPHRKKGFDPHRPTGPLPISATVVKPPRAYHLGLNKRLLLLSVGILSCVT